MFPKLEEVLPPWKPPVVEEGEEPPVEPKPTVVDKFKIFTKTYPKVRRAGESN